MTLNPSQKLSAAILRVVEPPIALAPYFGAVLRGLVRREMPRDQEQMMIAMGRKPTIGVTKDGVMYWSPAFVEATDVTVLAGVLVHEVMHVVLKHHDRAAALGIVPEATADALNNAYRANIAMDLAINTELCKAVKLPDFVCLPEKCVPPLPPGKTFEEYYALLQQREQEQDEEDKRTGGAGDGWCGSCAGHPMPGEPDGGKPDADGRSEADMERIRKQVAQEVQNVKDRGTVPGSLQRWADDFLKPAKIDWRTRLARLVRGAVAYRSGCADFTYSRMSRRQAGVGYGVGRPVVPALHSPKPTCSIVIDTSGSMSKEALDAALAETRGVLQAVGAGVTVCICDAEVHGIQRVDSVEQAAKMLKGGGGTAMAPALAAVAELKEKVSVCIVITDGYIDNPPEPPFSVIWCIVDGNTSFKPEYGDTVFVEE